MATSTELDPGMDINLCTCSMQLNSGIPMGNGCTEPSRPIKKKPSRGNSIAKMSTGSVAA